MTFIDGRPRIGMINSEKPTRLGETSNIALELAQRIRATEKNEGSSFISKPQNLSSEERTARVAFDQGQLQVESNMIRQQLGI